MPAYKAARRRRASTPRLSPRSALAQGIVQIFSHGTFEVIGSVPEKLLKVPRFTREVLDKVLRTWEAQTVKREVMIFLHSVGISPLFAGRIYTAYGTSAVEILRDNPHRQAMDIQGIGFRTADMIASKLGVAASTTGSAGRWKPPWSIRC